MRRVLTYGTFDLLHPGHIHLLRRASELGDHLTVGLSSDEFNLKKNKKSFYTYEDRKLVLESIKYVDSVIPEMDWSQKKEDIINNKIDVFTMGSDWEKKFDFLKEFCEVIYLERTEGISTTQIKSGIKYT